MADTITSESTEATGQVAFEQALDQLQEETVQEDTPTVDDEASVDVADTGEEQDQEQQDAPAEAFKKPAVEGPSPAMQAIAKQAGVPEIIVRAARDDAALQELMDAVSQESAAPEVAETVDWEVPLPEDDFSADDPVRKSFVSLSEHFRQEVNGLKELFRDATGVIQEMHGQQQQASERLAGEKLARFDANVSALQVPELGNGKLEQVHSLVRQPIWILAHEMEKQTGTPADQLAEQAARKLYPRFFQKSPTEAARSQRKKNLGVGQSKLPTEQLSPYDVFSAKVDKILGDK